MPAGPTPQVPLGRAPVQVAGAGTAPSRAGPSLPRPRSQDSQVTGRKQQPGRPCGRPPAWVSRAPVLSHSSSHTPASRRYENRPFSTGHGSDGLWACDIYAWPSSEGQRLPPSQHRPPLPRTREPPRAPHRTNLGAEGNQRKRTLVLDPSYPNVSFTTRIRSFKPPEV